MRDTVCNGTPFWTAMLAYVCRMSWNRTAAALWSGNSVHASTARRKW